MPLFLQLLNVGDKVLVESDAGDILWDASIADVSFRRLDNHAPGKLVDAYRVQYDGWGSRYCQWICPSRVSRVNDDSRQRQDNLYSKRASCGYGLPPLLDKLAAKNYIGSRDRARGVTPLPDFARISQPENSDSMNAATFAAGKAAILAIEAALPIGSIDATETGQWRPDYASNWRSLVEHADGPARLMACVILLEDAIGPEWIKEDIGHLRTTLPARWKAIGEASPSSLIVRIMLLDRSIMYGTIDRRRFRSRKKKL